MVFIILAVTSSRREVINESTQLVNDVKPWSWWSLPKNKCGPEMETKSFRYNILSNNWVVGFFSHPLHQKTKLTPQVFGHCLVDWILKSVSCTQLRSHRSNRDPSLKLPSGINSHSWLEKGPGFVRRCISYWKWGIFPPAMIVYPKGNSNISPWKINGWSRWNFLFLGIGSVDSQLQSIWTRYCLQTNKKSRALWNRIFWERKWNLGYSIIIASVGHLWISRHFLLLVGFLP